MRAGSNPRGGIVLGRATPAMAAYLDVGSDTVSFAPFPCTDNVPGRRAFGASDTTEPAPTVFFP
jgi:hypothetical protein